MTTEYFAELTDHTIEEAETLLKWAGIHNYPESEDWFYGEAISLYLWLNDQTIDAIRDGGGMVNGP